MPAGVKFGGYPSKQAQDEAIASGGPSRIDGKTMKTDTFDPNLRDEGAGFFSTLFTAGSNIGTDALTELGYLAQAVASPIDTGEAILRVAAGYAQKALPDSFEQYLPEDWATNKMYANAINDYYAEKYGSLEQAADSFAEQPVSVALDVFAVKALLTAVTKQAVKRSNATTKMAKTAEGTVLEGELAARAAADLKVAAELEKTVKYEGKLKYDESLGAYVPEAELAARTSLDAAEVAPIVSAIDEAVPTLNNAPLSTEGMMAATRFRDAATSDMNFQRASVLDDGTPRFKDADLPFESVPAATTGIDLAGTRAGDGSLMTAATRTKEGFPGEKVIATRVADDINAKADYEVMQRDIGAREDGFPDAASMDAVEEAMAIDGLRDAIANPNGKSSYLGKKGNDAIIAFADDLADSPEYRAEAMAAKYDALEANKAKVAASRADDAKMATATQADLFANGTAAQYELAQASRIANDLAKVSPDVPAVVGTRMMAPTESTKLAKYADVERRTTPPSIPQTKLNVDIKKVVPAVQRVAAASSQAERGADNSFLPMTPDKGIDLDEPFVPIVPERIDVEQPENTRPGWKLPHQFEGSTREGNYWSADFEDEHWNTPAGISEAMGIWGRPIGNRKIVNPR